eukprot:9333051-Alexandrium_andersonii.AAC.1
MGGDVHGLLREPPPSCQGDSARRRDAPQERRPAADRTPALRSALRTPGSAGCLSQRANPGAPRRK